MATIWDDYVDGSGSAYTYAGGRGLYLGSGGIAMATGQAKNDTAGGKYYFEIVLDGAYTYFASDPRFGIGDPNNSIGAYEGLGDRPDEWGWRAAEEMLFNNGAPAFYPSSGSISLAQNDVIGIAVDLDSGKIWCAHNNVWIGSPAAGTGAAFTNLRSASNDYVPAVSTGSTVTFLLQAHANDLTHAPPSGFSAWDDSEQQPQATVLAPADLFVRTTLGQPDLEPGYLWGGEYWSRSRSDSENYEFSGLYVQHALRLYDNTSTIVGDLMRRAGHGRRYFELQLNDNAEPSGGNHFGLVRDSHDFNDIVGYEAGWGLGSSDYWTDGVADDPGTVFMPTAETYTIGVGVDIAEGKVWFWVDGYWYGAGGILLDQGDPSNGLNPAIQDESIKTARLHPACTQAERNMQATLALKTDDFVNIPPFAAWVDFEPPQAAVDFKWDNYSKRLSYLALSYGLRRIEHIDVAADAGSGARSAFSSASVSTGKHYLEIDIDGWQSYTNADALIGITGAGKDPNLFWKFDNDTYVWDIITRDLYEAGSIVDANFPVSAPVLSAATTIQIALDLDNGRMWFGIDNSWFSGDPGAGTGSPLSITTGSAYAIAIRLHQDDKPYTLNARAEDQQYAPPIGFTAIDTSSGSAPALNVENIHLISRLGEVELHDGKRPYWDPAASDQVYLRIKGYQREKSFTFADEPAKPPYSTAISGYAHSRGKKYFEVGYEAIGGISFAVIGVVPTGYVPNLYIGNTDNSFGYEAIGRYWNNDQQIAAPAHTTPAGFVLGCCVDFDAGKIWYIADDTVFGSLGGSPDPAAGSDPAFYSATFIQGADLRAAAQWQHSGYTSVLRLKSSEFLYTMPAGYEGWGDPVTSMVEPKEVRVRTNIGQVRLESTYLPHIVGNFIVPKITMGYRIDNVRGAFRIPRIRMQGKVSVSNTLTATFRLPRIKMTSRLDEVAMVRGNLRIPSLTMSSYLQQSLMVAGSMRLGNITMNAQVTERITLVGGMKIPKPVIRAKIAGGGSSEYLLTNKRRGSDWEPYVSS